MTDLEKEVMNLRNELFMIKNDVALSNKRIDKIESELELKVKKIAEQQEKQMEKTTERIQ